VTPSQLRAFATLVRCGSVKQAAAELHLTESAISMHVAQLRKELGDKLFQRTRSGIAFTPGGLRLATRAVEILGLQEQTIAEVSHASEGRDLLRIGATSMFAEHAAPGLIEQFTARAKELDIELSVHLAEDLDSLLLSRAIDVAIGPAMHDPVGFVQKPFLAFDLQVVTGPEHPFSQEHVTAKQLTEAIWLLGPTAIGASCEVQEMLERLAVPEENQRIFQSEAAALDEAKRSNGLSLAVMFAAKSDVAAGRIVPVAGLTTKLRVTWAARCLPADRLSPVAQLLQFLSTPVAIQGMLRGSGVPIKRFTPSVYVTLWS
jgi:DNA-binding transcriptional LysR family regulator